MAVPADSLVVHLDIDYFFAQVEEVRLGVRGEPLGVQQNMEVAAVNYEARAFGLYNRISVADAKRLCPELILVQGDNSVNGMQRYRRASQRVLRCVMNALDALAPGVPRTWGDRAVESASFDDFYFLIPRAPPAEIARWVDALRASVLRETHLRCSVGTARTKLLAMLATKRAKPDGAYLCEPTDERDLLDAIPVAKVMGAGLVGLTKPVREALRSALNDDSATVAAARVWLNQTDPIDIHAALGDGATERTVRAVLDGGCDGSGIAMFKLPLSLSVECSVRPTDHAPATTVAHVRVGIESLAPMLVGRVREDQEIYGRRAIKGLVVKWKLFPGAKQVRQTQAGCVDISSGDAGAATAAIIDAAARAFATATEGAGFQISRVVLAVMYAGEPAAAAATGRRGSNGAKRPALAAAAAAPGAKQRKLTDMFKPKR